MTFSRIVFNYRWLQVNKNNPKLITEKAKNTFQVAVPFHFGLQNVQQKSAIAIVGITSISPMIPNERGLLSNYKRPTNNNKLH